MNRIKTVLLCVVTLACVGVCGPVFAGSVPNPTLTTTPNPPPADQEFAATFYFSANPAASGFWGEAHPPSQINGNVITIAFDEGCGFLCPPGEPEYRAFPFTMPALPAGNYVVRFAAGLDSTSNVLAEFDINVGNGVVGPVALHVGGTGSLLLAALMILLATAFLRPAHQNPKTEI